MEQIYVAQRFLAERFPGAAIAVLAGSTASGNRTETSDIDLLLIGDDMLTSSASSLAATFAFEGEIFEVFGYTRHGFEQWARKGLVAFSLFQRTAELMLLTESRWIGTGKYLPRRLRALSEERADALTQPLISGDLTAFADRAEHELRRAGGRLQEGLVR